MIAVITHNDGNTTVSGTYRSMEQIKKYVVAATDGATIQVYSDASLLGKPVKTFTKAEVEW